MTTEPFVGRRVELGVLRAAIADGVAGRGALVLLAGEPGIGKTRLTEIASEHARTAGMSVLNAGCWDGPSAPFWPWTQLLRTLLDDSAPADVRRLAGQDMSAERTSLEGDAEPVRLGLFDEVSTFLRDRANRVPLFCVIDDLHWADVPSLRLLAFLARDLRFAPMTVVGTFRDVEVDRTSDAGRALEDASSAGQVVKLEGLAATEVAELLATAEGALAPTEFARSVHDRTGGNPLFVRELTRLLASSGRSEHSVASLPVPESVQGVIRRRLARLPQHAADFLEVAAVFGQEFRLDLVMRASDVPAERALAMLDDAVAARLVFVPDGPVGRYAFTHALVRDVLLDALPTSRRSALHVRAAKAIEDSGLTETYLADLAHHYLQASIGGDPERAIDYSIRAGRRALAQYAYEDASTHLARALDAVDAGASDDRRAEILLDLGEAHLRSGDMPAARDTFEQAAELARRRGSPEDLARAALGFGAGLTGFEIQLFDQRQIELLEEALSALAPADSFLRAWLLARLSVALSMQESVDRRRSVAEEAVAIARRIGERRALSYALAAHCDGIAGPDNCELRLDEASEIVRLAREDGDRPMELLGRRFRVVANMEMGNFAAAEADIEAFATVAESIKQPLYQWYVELWQGMRALMHGRFDDALGFADEAERVGARAHSVNAEMLATVLRWMTLEQRGRPLEAQVVGLRLFELMPEAARPYMTLADAWLFAQGGDLPKARAAFREFSPMALEFLPFDAEWLPSMCQWSRVIAVLEEREEAHAVYEQLLPYRSRFGIEGIGAATHGSVEHHLGLLARVCGRYDDAVEHFDVALMLHQRAGARLLEARTMHELARVLRARAAPGDDERAAELAAAAAAIDNELGVDVPGGPAAVPVGDPTGDVFRAQGEFWTLGFDGVVVRMKDAKGLHDIATLLSRPGREVAAIDLATERGASTSRPRDDLGTPGHAGELLDDEARARYKARLLEIEDEIDEAETLGDIVRAEGARVERDALTDELSAAFGLGGRPRRAGDPNERARTAVTRRIKDTMSRIEDLHPALGRHLRNSVRTGMYCSYEPEQRIDWEL